MRRRGRFRNAFASEAAGCVPAHLLGRMQSWESLPQAGAQLLALAAQAMVELLDHRAKRLHMLQRGCSPAMRARSAPSWSPTHGPVPDRFDEERNGAAGVQNTWSLQCFCTRELLAQFVATPGASGCETVRLTAIDCRPVRCKYLILLVLRVDSASLRRRIGIENPRVT